MDCYLRKFCLVTKEVECTDAILGIIVIVIHDEPIPARKVNDGLQTKDMEDHSKEVLTLCKHLSTSR